MIYVTKSPKETQQLAGFLLQKIMTSPTSLKLRRASIIALEGELGAGKTTFVQGLARYLKIKSKIKSPTFALMKKYSISSSINFKFKILNYKFLYHLDCYRLRDHRDLSTLDIKEILNNPESIVLIEWADRVKKILPKKYVTIHIDHINVNTRKISIEFKI